MDAKSVITALGGAARLAEALGLPGEDVGAKAVRAWARRNSIPAKYFVGIAGIARDLDRIDITERTLAEIAHQQRMGEPAARSLQQAA